MNDLTNKERASFGLIALQAMLRTTDRNDLLHDPEVKHRALFDQGVADLLANLMHLCAERRVDFAQLEEEARVHYSAEILEAKAAKK